MNFLQSCKLHTVYSHRHSGFHSLGWKLGTSLVFQKVALWLQLVVFLWLDLQQPSPGVSEHWSWLQSAGGGR